MSQPALEKESPAKENSITQYQELLRKIALEIDPDHPEYLSDYERIDAKTENVELYAVADVATHEAKEWAEILDREINRVNKFFGIDSKQIPKSLLVIGHPASETSDSYSGAFAHQVELNGLLHPVIYSPDFRLQFGGPKTPPVLLRHEYLHSIDHILGEGGLAFSEIISPQVATYIFDIFPDLAPGEPDWGARLDDVLNHMKYRHVLPASDDLIDIVGEIRVLPDSPLVGHPKDSIQEFVVSLMNCLCDGKFWEGLEQALNGKSEEHKSNVEQFYEFIRDLVSDRVYDRGLGEELLTTPEEAEKWLNDMGYDSIAKAEVASKQGEEALSLHIIRALVKIIKSGQPGNQPAIERQIRENDIAKMENLHDAVGILGFYEPVALKKFRPAVVEALRAGGETMPTEFKAYHMRLRHALRRQTKDDPHPYKKESGAALAEGTLFRDAGRFDLYLDALEKALQINTDDMFSNRILAEIEEIQTKLTKADT